MKFYELLIEGDLNLKSFLLPSKVRLDCNFFSLSFLSFTIFDTFSIVSVPNRSNRTNFYNFSLFEVLLSDPTRYSTSFLS